MKIGFKKNWKKTLHLMTGKARTPCTKSSMFTTASLTTIQSNYCFLSRIIGLIFLSDPRECMGCGWTSGKLMISCIFASFYFLIYVFSFQLPVDDCGPRPWPVSEGPAAPQITQRVRNWNYCCLEKEFCFSKSPV